MLPRCWPRRASWARISTPGWPLRWPGRARSAARALSGAEACGLVDTAVGAAPAPAGACTRLIRDGNLPASLGEDRAGVALHAAAAAALEQLARRRPGTGWWRSPRTCCGQQRTRPLSWAGGPAGPRLRRCGDRRARVRGRGPVPGHRANRGGTRGRRRRRARGAADGAAPQRNTAPVISPRACGSRHRRGCGRSARAPGPDGWRGAGSAVASGDTPFAIDAAGSL